MTKTDCVSYLVGLHTLLEAQSKGSHSVPSRAIADEYEKHWTMFKDILAKEKEDETRQRKNDDERAEAQPDQQGGFGFGSEPDRLGPGWQEASNGNRPRV